MVARIVLAVLLLASCSSPPEPEIARTLNVSAERLAEIRSNPYVKRYKRGGGPTARLAGLENDRWPAGILFLEVDPYLEQLGFDSGKMIVEINGTRTHDIFLKRWRTRSAAGFTQDHYRDLIQYLFLEHKWDQFVLTVYLDVPSSFDEISGYVPKIERWRIKLK